MYTWYFTLVLKIQKQKEKKINNVCCLTIIAQEKQPLGKSLGFYKIMPLVEIMVTAQIIFKAMDWRKRFTSSTKLCLKQIRQLNMNLKIKTRTEIKEH